MPEMTPYEHFQLTRYGNVLADSEPGESVDDDKAREWTDLMAELELKEMEND